MVKHFGLLEVFFGGLDVFLGEDEARTNVHVRWPLVGANFLLLLLTWFVFWPFLLVSILFSR